MNDRVSSITPIDATAAPTGLHMTYLIEGILSFAANLLFIGIFFYTKTIFHWTLLQNFLLAAGQGAVYVAASLASQGLARRLSDRGLLIFSNSALAAVSLIGVLVSSQVILTGVIIAYVPLMALNWPVLEAATSAGADPHTLSRRIGMYNLIWAGTGALAVALQGTLLKFDPRMVFLVPFVIHVFIVVLIVAVKGYARRAQDKVAQATPPVHVDAEPALLRQRTLALWLSRIALPSTYVVIYSLSALMPMLPVMQRLDTTTQTVVGSVWMISRWGMFWFLGATLFWHTRPALLLLAAVLMGVAFVGVTAPVGLVGMMLAQVLLGAVLGLIYTASLYFGMVLSEGSTEHAGYHEALIGLGQVLGPGAGALTQWKWKGSLRAGVMAVSLLVVVSLGAAVVAAIKARRRV
jgi:hypothetical protein